MRTTLGAAVLCVAATQVAAQDVSSVFSLGVGEARSPSSTAAVTETLLKGRVRGQTGTGLSFGLQLGAESNYSSATSGSLDTTNFGVDASFTAQNNMSYGIYSESNSFSSKGTALLSTSATGLMSGYTAKGLSLKAFAGMASVKENAGMSVTAYGLNASYQVVQNLTLGASVSQHSITSGGLRGSANTIGVAAVYQPAQNLGLFGGFTTIDFPTGKGQRITEMGLGASYRLSPAGRSPILATVEMLGTDYASGASKGSFNTVRIGVTIPLGKAAKNVSVPINSAADKVFQPVRNVLGLTQDTLK